MSNESKVGEDIFRASRLLEAAWEEVHAMIYQLDSQITLENWVSSEKVRNLEEWSYDYISTQYGDLSLGIVHNYAVRRWKESRENKREPDHCLSIFVQLGTDHPDLEKDPLLVREAMVHVTYNFGGPWEEQVEPVWLSSGYLDQDGWKLLTDALWVYEEENEEDGVTYRGWLYSVPLGGLNSIKDLQRQIATPVQGLITSLDQLPEQEEAQKALAHADKVIRYGWENGVLAIAGPERLVREG